MINKKKELTSKPNNIAYEKIMLSRQRDLAVQDNNEDDLRKIDKRLEELDRLSMDKQAGGDKLSLLSEINKRNRRTNLMESQQAGELVAQEKKKKGQNALDPFARRKCMPNPEYAG
jgi:hypothetical protein